MNEKHPCKNCGACEQHEVCRCCGCCRNCGKLLYPLWHVYPQPCWPQPYIYYSGTITTGPSGDFTWSTTNNGQLNS